FAMRAIAARWGFTGTKPCGASTRWTKTTRSTKRCGGFTGDGCGNEEMPSVRMHLFGLPVLSARQGDWPARPDVLACRAEQQRASRDRFKWPPDDVAPIWNAWRYPATAGQLTWRV